uniref:Uncharacterized protein n=1 Tax=Leersia perrieri TaxID=77586 RepID=A0A0D9Y010_9ORYZ
MSVSTAQRDNPPHTEIWYIEKNKEKTETLEEGLTKESAEANRHANELLNMLSMESLQMESTLNRKRHKKEKQARKKAERRIKQMANDADNDTVGAPTPEEQRCIENPPLEHKENNDIIPNPESWVAKRFLKFLNDVREDLQGSVAQYLVAHGVDRKKADEAGLKFYGVPPRTTKLGRSIPRGFLKYIIEMHKKGFCWNGDWKVQHMKVINDGQEFIISEIPNYNISKEGMEADFKNFYKILFPFYEHEEVSDSGEKKKVLPCYFREFMVNCKVVPDPLKEPVKLQKFQRFLGAHPAFMSPSTLSSLINHLVKDCDSLREVNDIVYKPLQTAETHQNDWRATVRRLGRPFADVYWHFSIEDHETKLDIVKTSLMIGHYLAKLVTRLLLFITINCDIDGPFSTTWTQFEDSTHDKYITVRALHVAMLVGGYNRVLRGCDATMPCAHPQARNPARRPMEIVHEDYILLLNVRPVLQGFWFGPERHLFWAKNATRPVHHTGAK